MTRSAKIVNLFSICPLSLFISFSFFYYARLHAINPEISTCVYISPIQVCRLNRIVLIMLSICMRMLLLCSCVTVVKVIHFSLFLFYFFFQYERDTSLMVFNLFYM